MAMAQPAVAQFNPAAQQYAAQPYQAQQFAAQQPYQGYPATQQQAYQGYQPAQQAYPQGAVPPYRQQPAGRFAMMQDQGSASRQLPAPTENIGQAPAAQAPSVPAPAMPAVPVQAYGAAPTPAFGSAPQAAPSMASYPAGGGANCGCNTAAPAGNWEGYMPAATTAGCATGNCATGNCGAGNCGGGAYACASGANGYYAGGYAGGGCDYYAGNDYCDAGPKRQWFGGLYGLVMSRDNPSKANSAFFIETPPGAGSTYYPDPDVDLFFTTSDADVGFTGGGEVRFGSTFGCAADPCSCSTYQPYAWELGYWSLAEDTSFGEIIDVTPVTVGTSRIYGGINYAGLEYNRTGSGLDADYRPLNDYYDYQAPVDGDSVNDIRVEAVRVTQTFQVQNLELNFWRFGSQGVGPTTGAAACGGGGSAFASGNIRRKVGDAIAGYNQGDCGGCNNGCYGGSCGCDPCGSDAYACAAPAPRTRFFMNGLAGVRYLRVDETFRNAVFFRGAADTDPYTGNMPTTGAAAERVIFHDIETDNDLLGFQLGCSMNCLVGCRWTLFCDTNFGIYGNQIDQYQRVFSPGGGPIRFIGDSGNAAVRSSKEDVAFLGELRCGAGYQVSPRCRLTGAYRVIGVSGVALSTQNIQTPLNDAAFGHIDSNGSLVVHGFQGGVEFKY